MVVFVLVNHLQHDFCVLRVKLCADSFLNLTSHDFLRERGAVASLARHGIVGVGDGDNPRDFRDFLAFETFRVAVAVVALMMVVSADAYVRRLTDVLQDLVSQLRMLFYRLKFLVSEAAFLVDDCVGNADFSDIVQKRGKIYLADFSEKLRNTYTVTVASSFCAICRTCSRGTSVVSAISSGVIRFWRISFSAILIFRSI